MVGFIFMERVRIQVTFLGHVSNGLSHAQQFFDAHVVEGVIQHGLRHVIEIGILLFRRHCFIDGVQQILRSIVAVEHSTVHQLHIAADTDHSLDEHRIDSQQTVDIARVRRALPCVVQHLRVACDVGYCERVAEVEGEREWAVEDLHFVGVGVASVEQRAVGV